jgi:hypothetical protein
MRAYIYLVEVTYEKRSGWWVTTAQYSDNRIEMVTQDMWKWVAVLRARKMCKGIAKSQGTNKRLELQVRTKDGQIKTKDSYGSDPRVVKG